MKAFIGLLIAPDLDWNHDRMAAHVTAIITLYE